MVLIEVDDDLIKQLRTKLIESDLPVKVEKLDDSGIVHVGLGMSLGALKEYKKLSI